MENNKDPLGQSLYRSKTRTVQELDYLGNFQLLSEKIIEWKREKPTNGTLKILAQALAEMGIYTASLQMEQNSYEKIVSQYRSEKLKYQKEALEAVTKLSEYEDKYFKTQSND